CDAYDLSLITGLPPVIGSPQLATFQGDGAVQTVMVETTSHRLILLLDDNSTFTIWRQVPLQLPQGLLPTAPPQFGATATGLLASYTVDGGLVVGTSVGARSPWTWTDLSSPLTRAKFATAAGSVPALLTTSPPVVLVRATTGDLLSVGSLAAASGPTVTNVSADVGTGERVSSDVTMTMTPTGPAFGALDGGPIPLVNKIVLLAKSLDQTGSGVVETPLNTNCNPYTAYFGRGSTWSCPKGTAAEEWCSDFANWVWAKSGASVTGISGYSFTFVNHGQRLGTFKAGAANNPKPGDAVVWGYLASGVGNHVGLVVGVRGKLIDVVAGNAGPVTKQGYNVKVWESGYFDPTTSHDAPTDSIVGYITPVLAGSVPHLGGPPISQSSAAQIAAQDGGR
ncbi:MAG: CHAP domain-containing protein, partial [Actinomycetota bacterium]